MKKKLIGTTGLMAVLALVPVAQAGLVISNGDFENNAPGGNVADVDSWFDSNDGGVQTDANWWTATWYGPGVSPNGTSVLGLSYNTGPNWAYQSIGVNDGGLTSLELQYDFGSFTDGPGARDIGVTFEIYSVDGTYAGGADDTDIAGAVGASLVGSDGAMATFSAGQMLTGQTATIDISGTTGSELYLRIVNYAGTNDSPWGAVDNVQVIPEPATIGLVGVFGAGVLFIRRRFRI